MKQLTLILIGLALFTGMAQADEDVVQPPATTPNHEKVRTTEEFFLKSRVSELERRISTLEDELRYLKEKVRDMERGVENLRR